MVWNQGSDADTAKKKKTQRKYTKYYMKYMKYYIGRTLKSS